MSNPLPLELTDGIREAIGTAFSTGRFVQVAYVGEDDFAHISNRGSVVVLGPQAVGFWARKRDNGAATGVAARPNVTLFHTDLAEHHVLYTLYGTGRVEADGALADRVWTEMPERERSSDAERRGTAIIVELTRVEALSRHPELNFVMERGA